MKLKMDQVAPEVETKSYKEKIIKERGGCIGTSVGVEHVVHDRKGMVEFLQTGIEQSPVREIVFPIGKKFVDKTKRYPGHLLPFKLSGKFGNIMCNRTSL